MKNRLKFYVLGFMILFLTVQAQAVVLEQTPVNSYTGNAVAVTYPYTFKIFVNTDLKVEVDGVLKTLTTDYTVTGVGVSGGGNVVFVSAPAADTAIKIYRDIAYSRSIDYAEHGDLLSSTLNNDFDKTVMLIQQLKRDNDRAIKLPIEVTTDQTIAEDATDRAGKIVGFDTLGDMELKTIAETLGDVTTIGTGLQLSLSGDLSIAPPVVTVNSTYTATATDTIILVNGTFTLNLPEIDTVSSGSIAKEYFIKNIGTGFVTIDPYGAQTIDVYNTEKYLQVEGESITLIAAGGSDWKEVRVNYTRNALHADNIKVSSDDTTPAGLETKLVAGAGVTLTVNDPGGNETLTIETTATNTNQMTGFAENLMISNTAAATTYSLDITADTILLSNSSHYTTYEGPLSVTADITVSGAGGLDTGAEATSTWYYIWIISNGSTANSLLSASATAPTMPGGYTYKTRVGAIYNDVSGNFISIYQIENRVYANALLLGGEVTTATSLNISGVTGAIPTTAKGIIAMAQNTGNNDITIGISTDAAQTFPLLIISASRAWNGTSSAASGDLWFAHGSSTVYYRCLDNGGTSSLYRVGWLL